MAAHQPVLDAIEAELNRLRLNPNRSRRWHRACPSLAASDATAPRDVAAWVRSLPSKEANEALRGLVRLAQNGDDAALLVVIKSLLQGLLAYARRAGLDFDDVVSEAAAKILSCPLDRRRNIAGGIILDVRHAFWEPWQRRRRIEAAPVDPHTIRDLQTAPGELGQGTPTAFDELIALVAEGRRTDAIGPDEARLILDTRALGRPMKDVARSQHVNRDTLYARRTRAEARLAAIVAA